MRRNRSEGGTALVELAVALPVVLFVAFGVVTLVFAALRLSGDPAATMLPGEASIDELRDLRTGLGLDQPVQEQYAQYMAGIFTGRDFEAGAIAIECPAPCLGVSFKLRTPVTDYLMDRFPATLSLAVGAAVIFVVVGVSVGVFAARRRGSTAV